MRTSVTAEQLMARPELDASGLPVLSGRIVRMTSDARHGVIESVRMDGLYGVRVPATGDFRDVRAHELKVLP